MTRDKLVCTNQTFGCNKATSDARDRLLETADRLFYAEGVWTIGIDRIITESGVAKLTLCSHVRSKGDWVLTVLPCLEDQFTTWFNGAIEWHSCLEKSAAALSSTPRLN